MTVNNLRKVSLTNMNKCKVLFLALAMLITSVLTASEQSPFQRHKKLQLKNKQLCNQVGQPVQLRGMSTHGLQWHGWGESLTPKSLDVLAYDWKADVLRLAMYYDEGGYKKNPWRFRNMVNTLVEENHKRGLYSIIDWHVLKPGDPWARLEQAKDFFSYMAQKHGSKGSVLYEICNEPNGKNVDWARIKSYAEIIIPLIRQYDPDGIILVGTPAWASLGISEDKFYSRPNYAGSRSRKMQPIKHSLTEATGRLARELGGFLTARCAGGPEMEIPVQ